MENIPRRDLDGLQKKYPVKCIVCDKDILIPFKPREDTKPYCPVCWGKKLLEDRNK